MSFVLNINNPFFWQLHHEYMMCPKMNKFDFLLLNKTYNEIIGMLNHPC